MNFSEIIVKWYLKNKRDLPWRKSASPYHIWLSEIILQQTRVNQGLAYYSRFVDRYPTVRDLANAPLDEVLKLWQGLGYYSRARNLHDTAQAIVNDHHGDFPRSYAELLRFKGIGPYTAAAVASIAFREPVALVDGNVFRVLSRVYGISVPVDTPEGRSEFRNKAFEILDPRRPDLHNQAMMEFGALVCLPRNPLCSRCMLADMCRAYKEGNVALLPVKGNKTAPRIRYFNYFFIRENGYTYIHKRSNRDIWHSLYEFPLIESEDRSDMFRLFSTKVWSQKSAGSQPEPDPSPRTYRHQLTHQIIYCTFHNIRTGEGSILRGHDYMRISIDRLPEYAIPRVIDKYLNDMRREGFL